VGNQAQARCGGVCTWVSPKLSHLISAIGHTRCGKALWVRLSNVLGDDVAVLNVYVANSIRERCQLWLEFIDTLPLDCKWVLAGDWNFESNHRDKTSECGRLILGEEARIFAQLLDILQVSDPFPNSSRIKFSWDNWRRTGLRVLAILDRVYSHNLPGNIQPVEEYFIIGKSNHSDHLPIWCKLALQPEPKLKLVYKMKSYFLKDKEVKDSFTRIWTSHFNLGFFGKVRRCVKFYRQYCIGKAQERRFNEEELRTRLDRAMVSLQDDPANIAAQSTLSEILDQLKEFENQKAEGLRIRSHIKWNKVGDAYTKEFFQVKIKKTGAAHVFALEDTQGHVCHEQEDLGRICSDYYGKLYTKGAESAAKAGAEAQAFACFGDRLSPAIKDSLKCQISLSELTKAINEMKLEEYLVRMGSFLNFTRTIGT
jgi:hypothetical protein